MAKKEGGCHPPPQKKTKQKTGFSSFSQELEEPFFATQFLTVISSFLLGHLSIKTNLDRTNRLCSKIRQRDGGGGGGGGELFTTPSHGLFLTYFSNHEDDIQSHKFCCRVR